MPYQVRCENCGEYHPAEYSHEGQYDQGPIYAVVCTKDHLTDYFTLDGVEDIPTERTALSG